MTAGHHLPKLFRRERGLCLESVAFHTRTSDLFTWHAQASHIIHMNDDEEDDRLQIGVERCRLG